MTDRELLREYTQNNARAAFEEIVRRHAGWVSTTALRLTRDPGLGDDVTQAVFVLLSRKAASLQKEMLLSNWLFTVTRYCASNAIRNEIRRRKHERQAAAMRNEAVTPESPRWEELAPLLDELVGGLGAIEREAVLLRFYQQKSFVEIGSSLHMSEDAARKRVSRAVERLRGLFARRGVAVGATALGSVMSANLTSSAASAAVAGALAQGASQTVTPILKGAHTMLLWSSLKPAAIAVMGILIVAASAMAVLQLEPAPPRAPTTQAIALQKSAPATAPAVATGGVDGRVVDADEKPVGGVRIMLLGRDDNLEMTIAAQAQSDADGRFLLPPLPLTDTLNQRSRLLLQKAGYGLTAAPWDGGGVPEDPTQARITQATELRVRFVDSDGAPVAGLRAAPATIFSGGGIASFPAEVLAHMSRTTDSDGVVVFKDLPRKASIRLEVDDERFAALAYTDRKTLGETAQTDGGTIRLLPASTISGRIIAADSGKALAGVRMLANPQYDGQTEGRPERGGQAISDADGRFVLKRMRTGAYTIALSPRDDSLNKQYTAYPLENIRVAPGEQSQDHDIKLIPGGLIRGKVTVAETGRPLPGLLIGASFRTPTGGSGIFQSTLTGEDGSYVLRAAPGLRRVVFQDLAPPGLIQMEQQNRSREVEVVADQTLTVNFELKTDPNPPVTGKVVDSDGRPIRAANVVIERRSGAVSTTRTDINGRFTFVTVDDGASLTARRDQWSTPKPVIISGNQRDITIVMQKNTESSALIRVQQADGTPIAGAKLDVIVVTGERGVSSADSARMTGPDGTYLFKSLSPVRKHVIIATAKGFGSAQTELELDPGKLIEPKPLILPKADSIIAGIVLDENNQPVAGMEVYVNSGRGLRSARTDITGHFRLDNIVPGEELNIYTRPDSLGTVQRYRAGTDNAVILFKPTTQPGRGR